MTDDERYNAISNNDANYDGVFFYGVKSTSIFCRPSCQSKKPKRENVQFFDNAADALAKGFRPCKRCRSDLLSYHPMEEIAEELKKHLEKLYTMQFSWNENMLGLGLSERRIVDIFKETYGVTPKAYIDALRLKEAKKRLCDTDRKIIDIAAAVGFGSLSTFNRFFKEQVGETPQSYRKSRADSKANRASQRTR